MVLGGYAVLVTASQIRGSFAKAAAVAALPAPEFPDYHTPIVVSNDIPSFGTPEWEAFVEKDPNNFQVWLVRAPTGEQGGCPDRRPTLPLTRAPSPPPPPFAYTPPHAGGAHQGIVWLGAPKSKPYLHTSRHL